MTRSGPALAAVAAAWLFAPPGTAPTAAQEDAETRIEGPVEIAADALEVRREGGVAVFTGNVLAVRGALQLRADRVTVTYGDNDGAGRRTVLAIDAEGGVFLSTPTETAQGDAGLYDVESDRVTLMGAVVLTRGETVMRGGRLVLDLATGVSRMEGGPDEGGRVRALVAPGGEAGAAP